MRYSKLYRSSVLAQVEQPPALRTRRIRILCDALWSDPSSSWCSGWVQMVKMPFKYEQRILIQFRLKFWKQKIYLYKRENWEFVLSMLPFVWVITKLAYLSDCVFLDFEVDAADVDATHQDDRLVTLQRLCLVLLVCDRLLHQDLKRQNRILREADNKLCYETVVRCNY